MLHLVRQCRLGSSPALADSTRAFSSYGPLQKYSNTRRTPTKAQLAAKAKRRALRQKPAVSVYDKETMALTDAINVLRAVEVASLNSTYEIVVKTAMPRGAVVPKGRLSWPKEPKKSEDTICVFAEGQAAEDAKKAGAHIVGGPEIIDDVTSGKIKATTYLCSPSLIRTITPRLGRFLGPLGLMPSERRGTVTENFGAFIRRMQGTAEWRGDKDGVIRQPVAKMNWSAMDVAKNIRYFMGAVRKATGNDTQAAVQLKQAVGPGPNPLTKIVLSSTRGPGIKLSDA